MIILLELAHNSNFKLPFWILILLLKVYAMLSSFMSTTTQINMQPISLLKLLIKRQYLDKAKGGSSLAYH